MKLFIIHLFCFLLFSTVLLAGDSGKKSVVFLARDSTNFSSGGLSAPSTSLLGGRKTTAMLYSLVVPGSGQTLLGDPIKGSAFTVVAFGSALTALISHNNFVASNERLDALDYQYRYSTSWESSDAIYKILTDTYHKRSKYQTMRNTFIGISAVIWTLNIADVIFNTDDKGETIFSLIHAEQSSEMIAGNILHQQNRVTLSIPLN
ncbi:MAG: hypothetical protein H3C35_10320 [Bacteroidetes bacterium]|nr:hypothetical protein [Bacteroidota bacterium]